MARKIFSSEKEETQRGNSISVQTRLQAGRPRFHSRHWKWWNFFLFTIASRSV